MAYTEAEANEVLYRVRVWLSKLATYSAANDVKRANRARRMITEALLKIGPDHLAWRGAPAEPPPPIRSGAPRRTAHPEVFVIDRHPSECPFCESRELRTMPDTGRSEIRETMACGGCDAIGIRGDGRSAIWAWISPLWAAAP